MAMSPEELRAAAQQIAQKYGLDPEVFMAVINGESSFNPAAVGDGGHSKGIVQLFDEGLAPKFTQMTGMDPGDPNSALQAMEFMAQEVARKGGPGYEPWHASARLGIGPHQGTPNQVPGTPGSPGPRDRGVAAVPSPGWAPPQQQPSDNEGILAEIKKMMEPKHNTLLARGLTAAGVDLGDSTTLGGLLGNKIFGPTGSDKQTAKAQAALAKENPFSAVPTETDKLAKKKVAVPMMAATGQQPSAKPQTVGSGIFSWLRGLG